MQNLPPELLLNILVRLPPKDLLRYMCVNKAWYAFVRDQHFAKAYLKRSNKTNYARTMLFSAYDWKAPALHLFSSRFNDDEKFEEGIKFEQPSIFHVDPMIRILGCLANGLVCMYNARNEDITFWNPSIRKCKKIPSAPFGVEGGITWYEFGYDSASDDYKLVGIRECVNRQTLTAGCQVQIYSLKSNSWKRLQIMRCNGFRYQTNGTVFLNGTLHLLVSVKLDKSRYKILTLDLFTEKYEELPAPIDKHHNYRSILLILEDCLCFSVNFFGTRHNVWIMKEYGVITSWTLLYSIDQGSELPWKIGHVCRPLVFSRNGKKVLLKVDGGGKLYWFDLEKKIVKQVEVHGMPGNYSQESMYMGSLCLLDDDSVIVS